MHLNWLTWKFDRADGYGRQAFYMLQALSQRGHDISPLIEDVLDWPIWMQRLAGVDWSGITIANLPGGGMKPRPGRQWGFSMFEASILPDEWAEKINASCERLLVPCEHNARVFALAGVTIPIHVIPLGIDPTEYAPLPGGKAKRTFTFLAIADRALRKGWNETVVAFSMAFPASKYPDVRLVLKTREDEMLVPFSDSRITHWAEDCASSAEIFAQGDCFVFPSKGEGWGLPPREAVAMGIPTIVPRHTGLDVGIDCWATVILEKAQLTVSDLGYGSQWYQPDIQEIAAAMTWCYEHPTEAREKALTGSKWLHEYQTWGDAAQALSALLEKYA